MEGAEKLYTNSEIRGVGGSPFIWAHCTKKGRDHVLLRVHLSIDRNVLR